EGVLGRPLPVRLRGGGDLDQRLAGERAGGAVGDRGGLLGGRDRLPGQLAQVEVAGADAAAPVLDREAAELQGAEQEDEDRRDQNRDVKSGGDLGEAVAQVDRGGHPSTSRRRSQPAPSSAASSAAAPIANAVSASPAVSAPALCRPGAPKCRSRLRGPPPITAPVTSWPPTAPLPPRPEAAASLARASSAALDA